MGVYKTSSGKTVRTGSDRKGGGSSKGSQVGLNQSQVQQLKGMSGIDQNAVSSYEKSGSVVGGRNNPTGQGRLAITPEKLTPTNVYEPPVTPTATDPGDLVGAGMQGLTSMLEGYTLDNNQLKAPATTNEQLTQESNKKLAQMLRDSLGLMPEPVNQEGIYNKAYKESGVKQAQQELNSYTASLNSIVAKRDSDILSVEGQGRGIPEAIIGGQQAQINKEAAIRALPVQAQVAAAQGNLQFAQQQLETMFKLRTADAQASYQFKTNLINTVMDFASKSEQSLFNAKIADLQTRSAKEQANLQTARQAAMMAVETGQPGLISGFANLDPKSPTFDADYNRLLGQVRQKPSAGTQDWEVKDVGGILYKFNKRTGEIIKDDSGTGLVGGGMSRPEMNIQKYDGLIADIGVATTLADSGVGAGMIERGVKSLFSSNPDYAQLDNISDTVKTNLLALSDNPQLKKFFAAPMSDTDTRLLLGAESTLNPNRQTPEEFKKDLRDAADLFARAREAERQTIGDQLNMSVYPGNLIVAPDGSQIEITD